MNSCELLEQISNGTRLTSTQDIFLRKDFKQIFYGNGYMAWRKKQESSTSGSFNKERNLLLNDFVKTHFDQKPSEFAENALQAVYELALQHLNARLYGVIDNFQLWQKDPDFQLKDTVLNLYNKIISILTNGNTKQRDRIVLLLGVYAEGSLSQARKSLAGSGGELVVEALLQSQGLIKDKHYGTQFSSEGSDTDIVIPNAKRIEDVKAYIAIQISSNDRTRLTTSELVPEQRNYFISFNGCSASTKNTDDIGDEILAKFIKEDIVYVIVEKERNRAFETSINRLKDEKEKKNPDQLKITFGENRVKWLEHKSITFEQFIINVKEL